MRLPLALLAAAATIAAAGIAGAAEPAATPAPVRPEIFAPVTLTADLSALSEKERRMLGLFI